MTNKVDTSLWDIEAKQHSKRVYFNKPQLLTQYIGAKTMVIVAGRRTGKTDSIASPFVLRNMQRMPGSTGGIVVPTFKHGLTNTLPGLLAAWKRWGYINGVHYVVGRKPPKSFAKPITEPADYEHVITFYNGSVAIIISQDRPGSSNSLTLSWLLIDEAKFIDYNKLKDETLPANGGIRSYFGHHSFNHSMMVLSDMPQTTKGSWFLHYLDSLGYDRIIKEAQQDLYTIHATNQFSTLNSSLDCRTDSDIDPMQPLCIGMDYNANINWIVCGQPRANRLNILKSFYVKFERKIPALVADFCTYYAPHPNKTVIYYYDATALGSNYAVNDQDFHWVVVHEFERHGWQVIDVYLGNPMRHDEKYLLINQGFAGKQRLMPYFNRQNNDDLILAIQSAGVERGRNGFRKNKSMEKQPESEEDLLEHRTDGTDAFDTLYIGCEKFPQHDLYPICVGGVR